ncbi:MAG: polysaccharide biosynthesis C-terminal domain-containing protein [Armatimonadota bacterium]
MAAIRSVLVTGADGFIGKNLIEALKLREDVEILRYDINNSPADLEAYLQKADVVFHLAGVNRPKTEDEFEKGNHGLTADICRILSDINRAPLIAISSSIQAELDNPYGTSKRRAEEELSAFADRTGARVVIFRLKNVFGKWCRPNYNSVTATFCHNIARNVPITVSDPANILKLVYIDDVVKAFIELLNEAGNARSEYREVEPFYTITLGELEGKIRSFREMRSSLMLTNFEDRFTRALYATYLSCLPDNEFGYDLDIKTDNRGCLAEFMKSEQFGQLFVSRTKPGITRGNHWHHTKTEKFFTVEGNVVIRLRQIASDNVQEYSVRGEDMRVIDIPPGYTHSVENVGNAESVVLFWASEVFDPDNPDTYFEEVLK